MDRVSAPPRISIIIAAANAQRTLPATLDSIAAQDYPGEVEVVVAAADETTAEVARAHDVEVVDNESGTTPSGLNLAGRVSSGEFLVRVDAHSVIPSDYLTRVVATLRETGAEVVGGRQVPVGRSLLERAIAAAMSSPFGAGDARYRLGGSPGPADTVYLGAFRRKIFDDLGGYDERYVRHQDYELNHRVRSVGGTVWLEPRLEVSYRPRSSLSALASQYFQYGRWKRFFARQNPGSLSPRQWAPPVLVLTLAVTLVGSFWWSWLLAVPAGYVLALIGIGLVSLRKVGAPALIMPAALAVMHLCWGVGFLLGQTSAS
jgi:succinoglycan biosynthesis protein ExoA